MCGRTWEAIKAGVTDKKIVGLQVVLLSIFYFGSIVGHVGLSAIIHIATRKVSCQGVVLG